MVPKWLAGDMTFTTAGLRRPAYRRMMREAKAGHIERIYICRMSQISGQERHLISFFRRLMRYKVNVIATEYALNLKVPAYHMGTIIDEICARKGWERPWFVSESSERHCVSNAVATPWQARQNDSLLSFRPLG